MYLLHPVQMQTGEVWRSGTVKYASIAWVLRVHLLDDVARPIKYLNSYTA